MGLQGGKGAASELSGKTEVGIDLPIDIFSSHSLIAQPDIVD